MLWFAVVWRQGKVIVSLVKIIQGISEINKGWNVPGLMDGWCYTLLFFYKSLHLQRLSTAMNIVDLSLLISTRQSCSYPTIIYSLTCSYFSDICCYTSVLTYLSFSACGYCCSRSTDSQLEALPWSRRKGHHWNSFPTTGPVCRGRCIFSHAPRIPHKSGGSRRSRQVYL